MPKKGVRLPIPEGLAEILGKESDKDLAEKFGRSRPWIAETRRLMGIGSAESHVPTRGWRKALPDGLEERLGTVADPVLAIEFGFSASQIGNFRRQRKIRVAPRKPKRVVVPEAAKKILGTISDEEASEILDVSLYTVRKWRTTLEIPSYRKHTRYSSFSSNPVMEARRDAIKVLQDNDWTMREIGIVLGVSRARIEQLVRDTESELEDQDSGDS